MGGYSLVAAKVSVASGVICGQIALTTVVCYCARGLV